ncbi:MAG: AI-2E family transporter [Candidatus Shapirobacteria bacterium]
MKTNKIEISQKTIIFTILFLIALGLLWLIKDVIVLFFVCFILMQAINPAVVRLEKFKVPRILGIVLIYLLILIAIVLSFAGIIPILIEQTTGLAKTLPDLIKNASFFGISTADLSSQFKILESLPGGIANTAFAILSNLFSAIVILMVTFYLLLERKNMGDYSIKYFGQNTGSKIKKIIDQLEIRLGSWVSAEVLLMIIIGILSFIGYSLLGLKYAVALALIAGILEIVPNIGPIISVILASIIGFTVSPTIGLLTILVGTIVQQLENNLIVPKIMKETCNISPVITILLLMVGAKLGGVVGAIIAVPIYMTAEVIFKTLKKP